MRRVWIIVALCLLPQALLQAAQPEGTCKVLDPALQGRYEGPCLNGLAHGLGEAAGAAARYRGDFVAGRKHGQGVQTWANGDRYEGGFANDLREGIGEYVWGRGSEWAGQRYRGEFRADQRHGQGSYRWPDGRELSGRWQHDLPSPTLAAQMSGTINAYASQIARTSVPGARVCRSVPVGIGNSDVVGGIVRRAERDRLWIVIDRPGRVVGEIHGQPLKMGVEVVDSPEAWVICR